MSSGEIREARYAARYEAVVIGGSAGCFGALAEILSALPRTFSLPVLVVQHLHPRDDGSFARHLARSTPLQVVEPCDKEPIEGGRVYTAPANYHLLVERDGTIALSIDERVNWSRPAIDVLFESAACVWRAAVVAVILSGASSDGAEGMRAVKAAGGLTIAQDPAGAEHPVMPQAAIDAGAVDEVLPPEKIRERLIEIGIRESEPGTGGPEPGTALPYIPSRALRRNDEARRGT